MPEAQASTRMSMEMCLANLARTQPMESMAKPQCMKNTRYPVALRRADSLR